MTGCFLCPIHENIIRDKNDFELGYLLIESAISAGIYNDLWFIFSSEEEQDKFVGEAKERFSVDINYLICNLDLSDCKNPVTIKKYYGLKKLADSFDYIATIDCETKFYGTIDSGALLADVWNKGTYLNSNISKQGGICVKKCLEAMHLQDNELLMHETEHCTYAWWFNDIPVYEGKSLNEFFNWIDLNHYYETMYYNWECFDYLVYVIWLLLTQGKHLNKYDMKSREVIIESLWKVEILHKRKIEEDMGTHWTARTDLTNGERIHVQFHLDRRDYTPKDFIVRKVLEQIRS